MCSSHARDDPYYIESAAIIVRGMNSEYGSCLFVRLRLLVGLAAQGRREFFLELRFLRRAG